MNLSEGVQGGPMRYGGVGEHGILCGNRLALFPSREQAMAYCSWLFRLGLAPSYYRQEVKR